VPLFAFNSPQRGIDRIAEEFNGLQELLSRKDVGDVLFKFYTNLNLNNLIATDKYPSLRLLMLEYIFAQPSVLSSISDRKVLLTDVYNIAELKQKKYSENFSIDSTLLIIARTLEMDYPDFQKMIDKHDVISDFLVTGSIKESYDGEWEEILNQMKKIIEC
jgi:hypothetical protein